MRQQVYIQQHFRRGNAQCVAAGDRPALTARFPSTPLSLVHMASTTVIAHGPLQCASSEEELRRRSEWFAYSDDIVE